MPCVDTHSYVWIARTILPGVTGALMGGLFTLYTFAIVLLKWHLLVISGVGAIIVQVMLYHTIRGKNRVSQLLVMITATILVT